MQQSVSLIISAIAVLGSVCTAFFFYRNSTSKVSKDVISTYRERVDQLEKELIDLRTHLADITAQVNVLTGIVKAKDERIKTLEDILQNRNPEMEKSLQAIGVIADMSKIYMSESAIMLRDFRHVLEEMSRKMDSITTFLQK